MKTGIFLFKDEYNFLSNFYYLKNPINWIYHKFDTVENAYQATKCMLKSDIDMFCNISPGKAKRLGRKIIIRSDWENIKIDVMTELVRLKFQNNLSLKNKLLETNNLKLIEGNTWHDNFWGSCYCSKCGNNGKNHLGKILMMIRNELRG